MNTDQDVPKNHYCWICSDPSNKLKKLKYQSWMQMKSIKSSENDKRKSKLKKEDPLKIDEPTQPRLRLLNACSKKYFNLNLLMYTLEYQTSLLNKLIKNREDTSLREQIEKLTVNITHLQSCALKKFDEFNSKLDGKLISFVFSFLLYLNKIKLSLELEKSQSNTENTLPRFFNLQELYNQLQSLVYQ